MSAASTALRTFLHLRTPKLHRKWTFACRRFLSKYQSNFNPMPTKFGGVTNITVLPGVGIGPEIMQSTIQVLKAAEAPLSYEVMTIGPESEDDDFEHILTSIRRNKVVLKANIETKSKDPLVQSRNVNLRKLLDLYVYILPLKSFPGVPTRFPDIDMVMIRQNTEGEYLMLEHEIVPGSVEALKVITRHNTERLAEWAFKFAGTYNRKHITVVHTVGVHPLSEGLLVESVARVGKKYPNVPVRVMDAGRAAMELLTTPQNFDLIIATNLNGSMLSNFANGMLGGPALSAGVNLGDDGLALFEPGVRNKGSGIVNRGIANPTAMILAASNLLLYLGYEKPSLVIKNALYKSIVLDRMFTQELGGKATTKQFTDNVIRHVKHLLGPLQKNREPSKVKHKRWAVSRAPSEAAGDEQPCS